MRSFVPRIFTAALLLAACRSAAREPADETIARPAPAAPAAAVASPADSGREHSPDVRFLHHMIEHHAQALTMSALVPTRSQREDIRLLAERIAVSQRDEIAFMERWATRLGGPPRMPAGHHAGHHAGQHAATPHAMDAASMPGMLSAAQLDTLAKATGGEFDRLFLAYMIRHHEGALVMVEKHLGMSGVARQSELFSFISDIDADQRAEIRRMRALQARLQ